MSIDLSRIEPTQCVMHAKRLIDAWLIDPDCVDGWYFVMAQCSEYFGTGLHCWLERGGKVYDLTKRKKPFDKQQHYETVGVVNLEVFSPLGLLLSIWEANWAIASEVDGSILYQLDAFVWATNKWPDHP